MVAATRTAFISSVSAALSCDVDCATQVLLSVMSNIQERVAGEAIGAYTLNIRLPPASAARPVANDRFLALFRLKNNVFYSR